MARRALSFVLVVPFLLVAVHARAEAPASQEVVVGATPAASPHPLPPTITVQITPTLPVPPPVPVAPGEIGLRVTPSDPYERIEGLRIERLDHDWDAICGDTCSLARDGRYRITGQGMQPTGMFRVDEVEGDSAVARVKPANRTAFVTGAALAGVGAGIGLGSIVLLTSHVTSGHDSDTVGPSVGAAVGSALFLSGLVLLAQFAKSSVTLETAPRARTASR
jgi:hypothetical protein